MPVTGVKAIKKTNKNQKEYVVYKGPTIASPKQTRVKARKPAPKPAKLRGSITPGTVLIVLAGRFRGKRVVFLKGLESGLLLITGPFQINGVPLRRVNPAYVIATSTKLDISSVKIPETINDEYFKKDKKARKQPKTEGELFEKKEEKSALPENRIADQKSVDSQVVPLVKKEQFLSAYLGARFSLGRNDVPHTMKF